MEEKLNKEPKIISNGGRTIGQYSLGERVGFDLTDALSFILQKNRNTVEITSMLMVRYFMQCYFVHNNGEYYDEGLFIGRAKRISQKKKTAKPENCLWSNGRSTFVDYHSGGGICLDQ